MILNCRERTCSHFSFNFKYYLYKKRIICVAENKINKKKTCRFLDMDGTVTTLMMRFYCHAIIFGRKINFLRCFFVISLTMRKMQPTEYVSGMVCYHNKELI